MHLFQVAFYTAGIWYALFCQQILILYFLIVVAAYLVVAAFYPGAKNIGIRKKVMLATWTAPSQGVIHNRLPIRVDKLLKFLETIPKQKRPSLTHFVAKAMGVLLQECPDVNGKLVFGKFVPYETANITCLVDIDGGKDLAMVLLQDLANKGVQDIVEELKVKAGNIKTNKGDSDHKKRIGPVKLLPAFFVTALVDTVKFITFILGISFKPLAIKKNQFGAACLTSVGMLGFQDATAPFSGFLGCTFLVALNAVHEEPVIENGNIVIGKVAVANFVVDHRYVDGGRCKNLMPAFKSVFDNPQKFYKAPKQKKQDIIKEQQKGEFQKSSQRNDSKSPKNKKNK